MAGMMMMSERNQITVITSEPYQPIDRTKLSKALITDVSKLAWRTPDFYNDIITGKSVKSVDFKAKKIGAVQLKDGTSLEADLVVEGVGIRPSTDYLKESFEWPA